MDWNVVKTKTHLTSYALFRDLITARCPGVVLTVFIVGVRDKRQGKSKCLGSQPENE